MKITDIRTLCLSRAHEDKRQWRSATFLVPKADCTIVLIDTDAGLTGIGEACSYGTPPQIAAEVNRLKTELIGQDPTAAIAPKPVGLNPPVDTAVAGIDCALWDLRGKIANVRTCQLLTDAEPLMRIRLYASGGVNYDWEDNPETVVDEALSYIEAGFTAFKMRIGTHWPWAKVTVPRFLELIKEVTDAVDGRMELMLDGNQRLSEEEALTIARALSDWGWTWFEEPIPQKDIAAYARLNAAVPIAVTGGEQYTTLAQFEPYLQEKAYAIVQQDVGWSGLTEGMKIARRAHEFGIPTCPHNWHNGLMAMANAHLVAALPQPRVLELNMFQGPLQWDIIKQKPHIEEGHLYLPDAPGLGVELADDIEERFPYIEGGWGIKIER
ncbi:MAG: L-alanine-DL-glutamate epimerase-like enolase superfamily enzyme [Candidatus Latescibacterota bacterium]|jgi:L-alanine-DL-glutamate epimerase-like enolase superfamily enzyme